MKTLIHLGWYFEPWLATLTGDADGYQKLLDVATESAADPFALQLPPPYGYCEGVHQTLGQFQRVDSVNVARAYLGDTMWVLSKSSIN